MPTTGVKIDEQGNHYLEIDDFMDKISDLVANGWIFTNISRYDPTVIVGITPSGKAFNVTLSGTTVTLVIAGNTKVINVAKANWLHGQGTIDALVNARSAFPAGQR